MAISWAAWNFLRDRARDYQRKFPNPADDRVLRDLAKFCRANESTFNADPRIHAALEGRREVWLRIANHLHLSPEQLYLIYNSPAVPMEDVNDR